MGANKAVPSGPAPGSLRIRRQAANLSQTRREHASEMAEDYAEAIADLVAETGEARVVEMDAEGIEHHVSPETLTAVRRALRRRGIA